MARLSIDPVTRVGGHLRVEVDVSGGLVQDAWVSGTMYRGIERILEGRDPRDAWLLAQRICGTCGTAHARASVEAVEAALGSTIPVNARLIRNLLAGSQLVVDHVAAFYHRQAFDWVDVQAALAADPAATSTLATSMGSAASASYFRAIRDRLDRELGSGQPGPFASGYWGHPAYRLSPELGLVLLGHYVEALDWRRRMLRIHTYFGGKSPHPQVYLVGGMAVAPPWGGPTRPAPGEHLWSLDRETPPTLGADGLASIGSLLDDLSRFVGSAYVPDVLALAHAYRDTAAVGLGIGHYLAFGAYPEDGSARPVLFAPRGRVMDRDVTSLVQVGEAGVAESVAHAWYADDGPTLRHPGDGPAKPSYQGPRPPFSTLSGFDRYSWVKAPRYEDDPMEVGPLARMLVGEASGKSAIVVGMGRAADALGGASALFGTLGRLAGTAIEAQVMAGRLPGWLEALRANLASGDLAVADGTTWPRDSWPRHAEGMSIGESARGALGHWVSIADGRIEHYEVIDATTWNASPRDGRGRRGALEEALVGTPVVDPDRPVELLRTIHSFDPCLACAVH
jgi:Ni,Fe-hydrogenase I large subunit